MTEQPAQIVMEEITAPEALAKAQAQQIRFDRNTAWLQAHAAEVFPRYRGKCVCIAGAELFVAETPEEVLALAKAAHPDDDGFFFTTSRARNWPIFRKMNKEWLVGDERIVRSGHPR